MTSLARLLVALLAGLTLHTAPAHPNGATVPRETRVIAIRSAADVSTRVTQTAAVRQIVRWFNALPRFVPRPCPPPVRKPPTVTFVFRGAGDSFLGRAADHAPGSCSGSVDFSNEGQVKYAPLADDDFVARVTRLLGVSFDPSARTAEHERLARQDARSLLGLVDLPRGSRRLTTPPDKRLRNAVTSPGTTALVDRHRIWKVHESVDAVVAFEHAHRPAGSRETGAGTSDWGPSPSESLQFSFPALSGRVSSRELVVNMVPLANGSTGIRVDAQDIWVVVRMPSESVPAGVREIEIGNPALLTIHRITKPAQVRKIVRWFDALPLAQPATYACQFLTGPRETITFVGAGGKVLARAGVLYNRGISTPCNPIAFSIGGQREPPLLGGRFLLRVQRLVG
ncbi:MAG: hypothetical protein ACRDLM_09280 [Gaiellaceae bacterium]